MKECDRFDALSLTSPVYFGNRAPRNRLALALWGSGWLSPAYQTPRLFYLPFDRLWTGTACNFPSGDGSLEIQDRVQTLVKFG